MRRRVVTTLAFRGVRYYISEAFKSLWYNKVMAITSMITVMGSLLLLGFFMLIVVNVNELTAQIENQCEVQAFMNYEATAEQEQAVFSAVSAIPGIKTVTFVSKEDAFESYKASLGDDAVVMEGMAPDFLPASCRIVAEDIRQLQPIIEQVKQIDGIAEVVSQRETIDNIISFTSVIRKGCLISTLLLTIIAIFIIANTIKLDVHARQKEIHIMKYVGATDWFIRWPFIIEGIFVGIIGALISILLLWVGFASAGSAIPDFVKSAIFVVPFGQSMPIISLILIAFGALIGALGSIIAVRKHLAV